MKYLLYEKEGKTGVVKFNNPDALNALNSEVIYEMKQLLTELIEDKELRVLIFTGEGRAFIAGADIKEMENMTPVEARDFSQSGNDLMKQIEDFSIPVIAAVNGFALGGGLELALSCDFIIASKKAKMGLPEVTLGLIPGFGGNKRLINRIGKDTAKELIYTGRMIDAEEAFRLGIVYRVVEHEYLIQEVQKTVNEIIKASPNAVREAKNLLNFAEDQDQGLILKMESEKFGLMFAHEDAAIGTTAFVEKKKPVWS